MTLFRKLPVVVDAFQWTGGPDQTEDPEWAIEAIEYGVLKFEPGSAVITTVDGVLTAEVGDWVVRGAEGEIYPVKADIFAATYEVVA